MPRYRCIKSRFPLVWKDLGVVEAPDAEAALDAFGRRYGRDNVTADLAEWRSGRQPYLVQPDGFHDAPSKRCKGAPADQRPVGAGILFPGVAGAAERPTDSRAGTHTTDHRSPTMPRLALVQPDDGKGHNTRTAGAPDA